MLCVVVFDLVVLLYVWLIIGLFGLGCLILVYVFVVVFIVDSFDDEVVM